MGFAIASLMAQMFFSALILYWAGLLTMKKARFTRATKVVGFLVALPSAAVAALILAPAPASVASAEAMYWPGIFIGCAIGLAVVFFAGKRAPQSDGAV